MQGGGCKEGGQRGGLLCTHVCECVRACVCLYACVRYMMTRACGHGLA